MSVCLIDFEDSFTYNIVSYFSKAEISCDVIHWSKLNDYLLTQYQCFVFGPGPGHVDDYQSITPYIKKILNDKSYSCIGICLGHQLIFKSLGAEIVPWEEPLHGRSIQVELPYWLGHQKTAVQFYNSWGVCPSFFAKNVEIFKAEEKVLAAKADNFCSFQFHPESVGTSCPDTFFNLVFEIYYNKKDGVSFQNRRHLRSEDITFTRG